MAVPVEEWDLLAEFNEKRYPSKHMNVGIPRKCADFYRSGKPPSEKQLNLVKKIRDAAYSVGFDYIK